MSQFRDTFTKDEQRDNLLDYDDNAFMFFVCSVAVCALVPWTIFFIRKCLGGDTFLKKYPVKSGSGAVFKHCKCSACVAQRERLRQELTQFSRRFLTRGRLIESAALIFFWIALIALCTNLQDVRNIKTFDPFEILDVTSDASRQEIKKAYRLMSLKYHPDKNINDPTTGAKFIMIAKAYQTLTNEVSKKNYEKYGNPDGPEAMKIGVGLPRFLVEERNQLFVLSFFFLFLLVVLPMIFLFYYQRQKKYSPNGVLVETVRFLTHCMSEGTRLKNCPELLSASGESRAMKIEREDDKEMKTLCDNVVETKKRMFTLPIIVRNYYLILAHMQRFHGIISIRLRKELDQLLKDSLPITHCMLEIAVLSDWFHATDSIIEFRRCLIQALDGKGSSLLQIPHFNNEILKHCHRGKHAVRELADFLRQDPEERKGVSDMSPAQQADIKWFSEHVTNIELKATITVEDEEEIVVGDVATCHITMTRTNLNKGEAAGAVHAPYLPEPKYEEWWIFILEKNESAATGGRMLNFVRCRNLERVVEETLQFRVTRPGKNTISVVAMCDSYSGCDGAVDVEFKTLAPNENPREIFIHPDDAKLDQEPTLFQQMLGEMCTNSSDEEEPFDLDDVPKVSIKKKVPGDACSAKKSSSNQKEEAGTSGNSSSDEVTCVSGH